LHNNFRGALNSFKEDIEKMGLEKAIDYHGGGPIKEDYMPDWPETECSYLMMYEDCSEGTPISPAFKTPEELARWLVENNVSAFGDMTATYEEWLRTCIGRYAPSAYMDNSGIHPGVCLPDSERKI
jgi:hypothetical protein